MNEILKQLCTLYAVNGDSGCWDKDTKTRGKPCDCEVSRAVKITLAARDKEWVAIIGKVFGRCELRSDEFCPQCSRRKGCKFWKLEQLKKDMVSQ